MDSSPHMMFYIDTSRTCSYRGDRIELLVVSSSPRVHCDAPSKGLTCQDSIIPVELMHWIGCEAPSSMYYYSMLASFVRLLW